MDKVPRDGKPKPSPSDGKGPTSGCKANRLVHMTKDLNFNGRVSEEG